MTTDNQNYTATIEVPKPPHHVFECISDVSKWWGGKDLEGSARRLNDEFTITHGDVHYSKQKVIEAVPGRRVVWVITEGRLAWLERDKYEWTNTRLVFEIAPKVDGAVLRFTHDGLVPEKDAIRDARRGGTWSSRSTCSNSSPRGRLISLWSRAAPARRRRNDRVLISGAEFIHGSGRHGPQRLCRRRAPRARARLESTARRGGDATARGRGCHSFGDMVTAAVVAVRADRGARAWGLGDGPLAVATTRTSRRGIGRWARVRRTSRCGPATLLAPLLLAASAPAAQASSAAAPDGWPHTKQIQDATVGYRTPNIDRIAREGMMGRCRTDSPSAPPR